MTSTYFYPVNVLFVYEIPLRLKWEEFREVYLKRYSNIDPTTLSDEWHRYLRIEAKRRKLERREKRLDPVLRKWLQKKLYLRQTAPTS